MRTLWLASTLALLAACPAGKEPTATANAPASASPTPVAEPAPAPAPPAPPPPSADAGPPTAGTPPKKGGPHFAWKAPCRVPVTERVVKKGQDVVFSYVVSLASAPGGGFELQLENMNLVKVGDRDATSPTVQRMFANVLAQLRVPTLVLNAQGEYTGAKDLEKTVDQILAMMPKSASSEQVSAYMHSPQALAMLEEQSGDIWNTWVALWDGWEVASGTERTVNVPVEAGGKTYKIKGHYEHLGPTPGAPGLVRLRVTETLPKDYLIVTVGAMLADMAASIKSPKGGPPKDLIKNGERTTVYQVDTDPATLRPWRASKTMDLFMEFNDGTTKSQHESRATEFDWSGAVGCTAEP
jgi:hypothetical protein